MYLYKIECDIDKKVYAGITNNIKRRWKEHRSELRGNRHHNSHLQYAWNKYGENVFKFLLINEFDSLDTMNKAEIDYIDEFGLLNSDKGYNLASGGCAFEHSLEAREKIAKSNEISVISKCLKTGEEKIYNKILDVKLDGLDVKSIANPCTGRALTYKGRVWMYLLDHNERPDELNRRFKSYQNTKARPAKFRKTYGMNIQTKEIVEYKCTSGVNQDGFNVTNVYGCCAKPRLRKAHGGFVWSFDKEKLEERRLATFKNGNCKDIYRFTISGEFIGKLSREGLGRIELSGISSVCTGIKETYKGFKYSYEKILTNTKYTKNSFNKYDKKGILMKTYLNMSELLLDNPDITNTSNIYRCCKKERNTAYGFKWSYGGGLSL